jgi:hypothetical protein
MQPEVLSNRGNQSSMLRICAFTSAAGNYLPKVRLLCQSLKKFHPEFEVYWAIADEVPKWLNVGAEPFDCLVQIDDLKIPNVRGWLFGHTIAELSTAIKPFVVQHLLEKGGADAILYFDPDIVLFSRLDDLVLEFDHGSILLTPHQTKPETELEAVIDNEIGSLRHGIFNLGFLGVKNDENGRLFTDWWRERLYCFCHELLDQHLWNDQKWIDFVPVFFEGVRILKCSRFNVAPWNITTRTVKGSWKKGFTVDGEPLGFYHFTGFDTGAHRIMSTKYGGNNVAIKSLVEWYEKQATTYRDRQVESAPWAFGSFSNGAPITKNHRLVYRLRRDLQDNYPNPFEVCERRKSYYQWFQWRAPTEYPELFSDNAPVSDLEQKGGGGKRVVDWRRIRMHARRGIKNMNYGVYLVEKAWKIWRAEGWNGIKTRLHRRQFGGF